MIANLDTFLLGVLTTGHLVVALFFATFWRRTRDRLFAFFAVAFLVQAANQVAFLFSGQGTEQSTHLYLVRLGAFSLIIYAVIDKNRH